MRLWIIKIYECLQAYLSGWQTNKHIIARHTTQVWIKGKIQGDGRKFLDRFKNYFGSQFISSQSLSEVHIYQKLLPKSAAKGDFFHIFLSLVVSSRRHGLQMANEADEVMLGKRPR